MKSEELLSLYQDVWNRPASSDLKVYLDRGFLFQFDAEIKNPDILFIGINPSYNGIESHKNKFYEKDPVKEIAYFKRFHLIEEQLKSDSYQMGNLKWTHLDLLAIRETSQKVASSLERTETGMSFIFEQLMIAKKIIAHSKPKLIVVSNTLARKYFGKEKSEDGKHGVWMGYNFTWSNELGTHTINELGNTPVLFSGMLSGQRALDLGSLERLIWQINLILKNPKNITHG